VIDLGLAAFVCVTPIEALTHTAVLHRSDLLTDDAVETLVDEATRLVVGCVWDWVEVFAKAVGVTSGVSARSL
jgi:hypothetical protein